eukprot:TRINITY_DN48941_c0_g1_i1.p1 TRINITY_DN48941_c0_g1~~TRINITY_DN48941_c0_g1_i1.p1  ORF type:complete len:344 (+),score=69.19 TRINITY_DN48941_c0_g1_i1:52-1032(+)
MTTGLLGAAALPMFQALFFAIIGTIAPDHLCLLMVLSAGMDPGVEVFRVGFFWGLFHCIGMAAACGVAVLLRNSFLMKNDYLDHYGHYFIGFLMMVVSMYFIIFQSYYIQTAGDDDGCTVRRCACHGYYPKQQGLPHSHCDTQGSDCSHEHVHDDESGGPPPPADLYGGSRRRGGVAVFARMNSDSEEAPLLGPRLGEWNGKFKRILGALVGLVQGFLCPTCMVGLSLIGTSKGASDFGAWLQFLVALVVATSLLNGLTALTFAWGSKYGMSKFAISPLTVYRFSCAVCFTMGLVLILLNFTGAEQVIEKFHGHLHERASGDSIRK